MKISIFGRRWSLNDGPILWLLRKVWYDEGVCFNKNPTLRPLQDLHKVVKQASTQQTIRQVFVPKSQPVQAADGDAQMEEIETKIRVNQDKVK